jgi:hypothetical protein
MVEYVQSACNWIASWPWSVLGEGLKSYVLPLAAPAAAFYVASKFGHIQAEIGRRQADTAAQAMATNREKLRLDLFERRLAVYEAANTFITMVIRNAKLDNGHRLNLLQDSRAATWLFDEATARFITDTLFSDAFEVVRIGELLEVEPDPEERKKLVLERNNYWHTFKQHSETLHEVLAPYLRFSDRIEPSRYKS